MTTQPFPTPPDEESRLSALADYHLLDTPVAEEFARLVKLAARLFNVPIVQISLVDRDRQFFLASVGVEVCETSREISFCAHAILENDIMFVPDAMQDLRFATNPLVLGPPFIRFYAGKPLVAPGGAKVGTLCLIDSAPHATFSEADRANLSDLAGLVTDCMEIRRLSHVKSDGQARFESVAAASPDAIICSDEQNRITFCNRAAEALFGYTQAEMTQHTSDVIVPPRCRKEFFSELMQMHLGVERDLADAKIETIALRKDGSEFPIELSLSTWQEGNAVSVCAVVRDVTERRENADRLSRLALRDPLTDLPNRGAWQDHLTELLAAQAPAAVLMLDLDRFGEINETLGQATGDAILKVVADRLVAFCGSALMVARLGGDKFAVLLAGNDLREACRLAERLVADVSRPIATGRHRIEIGVSIGVAAAPTHGDDHDALLTAAELALFKAKTSGKGRHAVFAPAFREVAVARRNFRQALKTAFENGEFGLYYQPQVALATRALTGAEALIRWHHPQRGLLSPASFIDILNEKPCAAAVGEWCLLTACKQAAAWRVHNPDFRIGVNLFEAQLRSPRLLTAVQDTLDQTGLPSSALELEIVESIMLSDDSAKLKILHGLREIGVGLAFDDYGTGFASLSVLKRIPVTRLKIDQTFVRDVISDPEDAAVVKAVIYLAKNFGLEVIAEGVETEAQLEFLKDAQCTEVQGYLFGRPAPADTFFATMIKPPAS